MRVLGAIICACLVLIMGIGFTQALEEEATAPAIEVEKPTYDFQQVPQGEVVKHDFRVLNRGNAPLEISKVKPG